MNWNDSYNKHDDIPLAHVLLAASRRRVKPSAPNGSKLRRELAVEPGDRNPLSLGSALSRLLSRLRDFIKPYCD